MLLWFRNLVVVPAALLVVVACGSSSLANSSNSPSPSSSHSVSHIASVDPCSLVTQSEASAVVGKNVQNLVSLGGPSIPGACFYGAQHSSVGVFVYAQVYPDTSTADAVTAEQFQTVLAAQLGKDSTSAEEVSGIGDKAFEFGATGNAGKGIAIIVFKANVVFIIAVDPTNSPGAVEGLAKNAVNRLQG
jgi:hypothetical protein